MTYAIPDPEDFGVSRADMTFGMRRAARYFNELVAPGVSGASMTRHFTWCVLGLDLARMLEERAGCRSISNEKVASGIEALAGKLEYHRNIDASIRGRRAFARHPDVWDFSRLSQRQYYVQTTYRQQTTRALPEGSALGFAVGSGRFNAMDLTGAGRELARIASDQTAQNKYNLSSFLLSWVEGALEAKADSVGLCHALAATNPTPEERYLVFRQLDSVITGGHFAAYDSERRRRLIEVLAREPSRQWSGTEDFLDELEKERGGPAHAHDIRVASAFEEMRFAGALLVIAVANMMERDGKSRTTIGESVEHPLLREPLEKLAEQIGRYKYLTDGIVDPNRHQADTFGSKASTGGEHAIRALLENDGRILTLDGNDIFRGPLFRADMQEADARSMEETDEAPEDEAATSTFHPRLGQFIQLWRDCHV